MIRECALRMNRPLRALFALLITSIASPATAGARGLNVVFVNIGPYDIYQNEFYKKYLDNDLENPEQLKKCWEDLVANGADSYIFEVISRIKRPKGLDAHLGRKIWAGEASAQNKARNILRHDFEYKPGQFVRPEGYDGMYIFNSDGKTISMMSIGAHKGVSKKISIPIDSTNPRGTAAKFSHAMCKIGAPLMIDFGV